MSLTLFFRVFLFHSSVQLSFDDRLDDWKPSVYWVMLCLFLATAVLSASASALYSRVEQWSYEESLYFCFVAFSTIGFGDLVPNQRAVYPNLLGARNRSDSNNNDTSSDDEGDTALLYFQVRGRRERRAGPLVAPFCVPNGGGDLVACKRFQGIMKLTQDKYQLLRFFFLLTRNAACELTSVVSAIRKVKEPFSGRSQSSSLL